MERDKEKNNLYTLSYNINAKNFATTTNITIPRIDSAREDINRVKTETKILKIK
jgi:hypothetical protein